MDRDVLIFGRRLAAARKDCFLTQEELAQRLEMSPANVRRLEQSETGGMRVRTFRRLAELLRMTPDVLRQRIGVLTPERGDGTSPQEPHLPSGLDAVSIRPAVEVDHFHGVSAAKLEEHTDEARRKALIPAGSSKRFCVTVSGDCMEPKYRDGEVVVFSVDAAEREGIVEGKSYFIQFSDGSNTFKRIFLDPNDREVLVLRPWNPRHRSKRVERSQVRLLARAIYRLLPDE